MPINRNLTRTAFDATRFLVPVSEASPVGESLRYEGTHDEIRAARAHDDPALSRGVWETPLRRADWLKVEVLCIEALERRSKDLQIAAWLTESWLNLRGFAGLQEGLRVLAALCERFWDELHPRPDPEDPEYRFAPFVWMNEKLPLAIKAVPVCEPESTDVKKYCWADWELAQRPNNDDSERSQANFQQSVMLTPAAFYKDLYVNLDAAVEACSELESFLESRGGPESPGFGPLLKALMPIRDFVAGILSQRNALVVSSHPAISHNEPSAPLQDEPFSFGHATGPIQSRAEAYRRLAEAADYLAYIEPHSPTPYLVRRAIRWGSMQFSDLMSELVRNGDELREIYQLLQIQS